MPVPTFANSHLRVLAKILAECVTHAELSELLDQCGINSHNLGPRWERIQHALATSQRQDGCGNGVWAFIQAVMDPVRFIGRTTDFRNHQASLNAILAFNGVQLGDDGQLKPAPAARTLNEAQDRAGLPNTQVPTFQYSFHPEIERVSAQLYRDGHYKQAALEAYIRVIEEVKAKSGITDDGDSLMNHAFGCERQLPIIQFNSLQTDAEKERMSVNS